MPIYEFACANGHKIEKIMSLANATQNGRWLCNACGKWMERIWSLPANPQIAPPTVVFTNKKTGQREVAIYRGQPNPEGFEKEELKGPFERTRFEHEMQEKHNVENELVTERNFAIKDQTRKNRHSDINARLTSEADKSENPAFTKDLMKLAMQRSDKKRLPHKKTEFHLAVNHTNKGNLDKG